MDGSAPIVDREVEEPDPSSGDPRAVRDAALAELRNQGGSNDVWDSAVATVRAFLSRWVQRSPLRHGPEEQPIARSRWVGPLAVAVGVVLLLGAWMLLRRPPDPATTLPRDPAVAADRRSSAGGSSSAVTSTVVAPTTESTSDGNVVIHVAGAVNHPGVVTLPGGARAVDAVDAAGGLAPGADPDRVNLAAPLVDGSRLVVPLVGQPAPVAVIADQPSSPGGAAAGSGSVAAAPSGASGGPVDINTADATALDALPGIGPTTAAAILSHRDENGRFTSVDELLDVRGIGQAKFDALRDLVVAGP